MEVPAHRGDVRGGLNLRRPRSPVDRDREHGDVLAMRRTLAAEARFAPAGGVLFILGIVFGFITAQTADLDLTPGSSSPMA
jgi:hypothetical protein